MREVADFDSESHAKTLAAVLGDSGVETEINQGRDGSWRVWVLDDHHLEEAKHVLERFEANPTSDEWQRIAKRVEKKPSHTKNTPPADKPTRPRRQVELIGGVGQATLILILLSVAVALITELGNNTKTTAHFTIASYVRVGDMVQWYGLSDLKNFELWRLFTPMLVHFGMIHLLFNMWWLKDLGTIIEVERSRRYLVVLVLVISGLSNFAQYHWPPASPTFGGMSGVVYGLLGYLWMRGKFDPRSRLRLQPGVVVFMMGWLVLCFTGLVGPVANGAHVAGLVVGAAWGYLSSGDIRRRLSSHKK